MRIDDLTHWRCWHPTFDHLFSEYWSLGWSSHQLYWLVSMCGTIHIFELLINFVLTLVIEHLQSSHKLSASIRVFWLILNRSLQLRQIWFKSHVHCLILLFDRFICFFIDILGLFVFLLFPSLVFCLCLLLFLWFGDIDLS